MSRVFSYKKKFFLIYAAIISIAFYLVFNLLNAITETEVGTISKKKLEFKMNERIEYTNDFFHPYKTTISSITSNKNVIKYLSKELDISIIEQYFLSVKKSIPCILQVKYIDKHAQEIIKIVGTPTARTGIKSTNQIVNKKDLQNKINTNYIQKFLQLKKGEIGISNIELANEHNKFITPKKPIIRFGMKVYDKNNHMKGIIVINVCLQTYFEKLDKIVLYNLHLIDKSGKYIYHHDKKFGLLGKDINYTLYDELEQEATKILSNNKYTGIHIYTTKLKNFDNGQGLIFILTDKFVQKSQLSNNSKKSFILIIGLLAIVLLPLIYYFAKQPDQLNEIILEQTNELQEKIAIISKYIIYSRTDKNGIILDVSDAFCKISGYSRDELIGSSHNIIRHPDTPDSLFKKIWSNLNNKKSWQGQIQNKRKDGSAYWIYSDIQPKLDKNGEILEFISVRSDITVNKKYEKQQIQMLEQAKMAAMGEMIGNIAHQWRQPLSIITTIASGVSFKQEYGTLELKDIPHDMDNIVQSANYLSETIETFRNFLLEKKERKDICIQNSLHEILNILSATLKNNHIFIENNVSNQELITINMVSGELEQVIINIINNAKDVFIEKNQDKRWIKIDSFKDSEKVILTIEDNGGGIPEEIMPKIFEPYFTTKHKSIGTGLGLHMSYKIVTESLNGKLSVQNTNNGAKFYIEIPYI